jgi:FKBP-type peptidyl-prolyl cis-trans isomerase SlyD
MRVERDRVVSIDYVMRLADGTVVESTTGDDGAPLTYLHGRAQIVPGIESALEGAEPGASLDVVVPPAEGFGERDPGGIFTVPRSAFPPDEEIDVGSTYSASRPDGRVVLFRVLEAQRNVVLIDTNHPLAGETLHVVVAVRRVREATGDELRAGRAEGVEREVPLPS